MTDDFEILDFGEDIIESIDTITPDPEKNEDLENSDNILNEDLITEKNKDDLELTPEELEAYNKKLAEKETDEDSNNEDSSNIESGKEDPELIEDSENIDDLEDSDALVIFAKELKERNILDIEDDWNGDEEALYDAYIKTAEVKAEQLAKERYQLDNPKVDAVLQYLKHGGNIDKYIQQEQNFNWINLDVEQEDSAKLLVKTYLQDLKQLDESDVNKMIESYIEDGVLSSKASKIQSALQEQQEAQIAQMVEAQEKYHNEQRELFKQQTTKIKGLIDTGKAGNFVINKNKKKDLENYIFTPVDIKNENNEVVGRTTEFKQVLGEYVNDPEKLVQLAYLLFEGLENPTLQKQAEKKVRNKLSKALKSKVKKQTITLDDDLEVLF